DPVSYGGQPEDAFDVVVPDLPGFGFSDKPKKLGTIFHVQDLWANLMTEVLGYKKFVAHGGDWGGTVTGQLARSHPDKVLAIQLTDVPFGHLFQSLMIQLPPNSAFSSAMISGCKKKAPMP